MSSNQQSLLDYYSSETAAHTTNLLADALLIVTAVQVLRGVTVFGRPLLLAVALFILSAAGTWMIGRMLYWAALANIVIHIDQSFDTMGTFHNEVCARVPDREYTTSRVTRFSANFYTISYKRKGIWVAIGVGILVAFITLFSPDILVILNSVAHLG